ncbi:MAG: hypothetical protein ABIU05_21810 [Nitrospirales bacterium]
MLFGVLREDQGQQIRQHFRYKFEQPLFQFPAGSPGPLTVYFVVVRSSGHPNRCSASRFDINWGKPAPQGGIAEIERPTGLKYGIPLLPHELHFF